MNLFFSTSLKKRKICMKFLFIFVYVFIVAAAAANGEAAETGV